MYGFIVDISSTLPFMAFSQGDTYVFKYSSLFFSFKAAALVLSAPVDIFNHIKSHRKQTDFGAFSLFSKLNQLYKNSVKSEL